MEIYKIKGININEIEKDSPLGKWYFEMVKKNEKELTLRDISHMFRQNVYLDIAIPISYTMLLRNPFCGELYEGEILELVIRVLEANPEMRDYDFYNRFSGKVNEAFLTCEEDSSGRAEYKSAISKLEKIYAD